MPRAPRKPSVNELTEEIILLALTRVHEQLKDDTLNQKMHLDAAKAAATLLEIKKRVPNETETGFDASDDFSNY